MSQVEKANQGATLTERFANMNPAEFRQVIEAKWNATEQVLTPILSAVEEGHYSPIEGAKAVACLTGELFGYGEFHGSVLSMPPAELLHAIRNIGSTPDGTRR